jgi:glycosyltransferase involved in cell wall biosynthesis
MSTATISAPAVDVTVVVCTYNRAGLVRDTLRSLMALETDGAFRYEVLVVDNASTDETPQVLEEIIRSATIPLRSVREAKQGVSCARNRGIAEATGTWIAFFDDDQVADPHWLKELLRAARDQNVRCVGGANRLLLPEGHSGELSPVCCELLSESVQRKGPCRYSRRSAPGAGNLLLHRSVFEEVGVFNESLREAGEDADLYRRMVGAGIVGWYHPPAISHHVVPAYRLTPAYLRWKSLRNGGHVARRNRQDWGRVMFFLVLLARIAQSLLLHVPKLLWAKLRRSDVAVLGARCRLWRSEGYIRFALKFMAPRLFAQQRFFSELEFRAEREMFATQG